jgi:ABC-type glycerol-3-phosphate transport system substrate-binding protein
LDKQSFTKDRKRGQQMNGKVRKQFYQFFSLLFIFMFLLSACSQMSIFIKNESATLVDENESNGIQELTVSAIPAAAIRLRADAEAFMAENPHVHIKINEYEESVYKQQAPELFTSSEKPDVAWYWAERWYHQIVESHALEPLDDLYESERWNDILPESTLKRYTSPDGYKYSVNVNIGWTPVMFFNKKAFSEAGVKVPKTFDELFDIAKKLKEAGYIPLVSGVGETYIAGHIFDAILQRSVTEEQFKRFTHRTNKENHIDYTNQNVINAWDTMRKMAAELMPENVTEMTDDEARALFIQGKAAIYSSHSSRAGLIEDELPQNFEAGFFYYPQVKKGIQPKVQIYTGDALMALKGTGKEQLAKKFIAYVMSYDRQKALTEQRMFVPSRTDLKVEDLENYGPLFISMYKEMNRIGTTSLWDDDIPGEMANKSFELHQSVMAGSKKPEQASKELQDFYLSSLKD